MSGNLWMFSDKLDDEDIEILKHIVPSLLKSLLLERNSANCSFLKMFQFLCVVGLIGQNDGDTLTFQFTHCHR